MIILYEGIEYIDFQISNIIELIEIMSNIKLQEDSKPIVLFTNLFALLCH